MANYLKASKILDYSNANIQALIKKRGWLNLSPVERTKGIYNYVRDEILFGYNLSDDIPASAVLADGYGQCNTKSTLLMALLRAVGIPNRLHGFTIEKTLQKGAITGIWYKLAPKNILHTWVEVFVNEEWYFLEGVIIDKAYLKHLQAKNEDCSGSFCGYGVFTNDLQNPEIEWNLNHTTIQEKGINQDFGLFDTPDEFYAKYMQKLNFVKRFLFKTLAQKSMNRNVRRIRNGGKL